MKFCMPTSRTKHTTNKAFTLIELLVVISIIALLISILLPALRQARASARAIQCLTGLRQSGMGVIAYSEDFKLWMMCHDAQQQLPSTSVKTPLRYERYWSIQLKRNGYLPKTNVAKFEKDGGWSSASRDYYWTATYKSFKDITICPESPQTIKYMRADYMDYGMRKSPWGAEEQYDGNYRTVRIDTVSMRKPYLMDSGRTDAPHPVSGQTESASPQFNGVSDNGVTPKQSYAIIARRHLDSSNAWMPDGSGKRMGQQELLDLEDNSLPYSWFSQEF